MALIEALGPLSQQDRRAIGRGLRLLREALDRRRVAGEIARCAATFPDFRCSTPKWRRDCEVTRRQRHSLPGDEEPQMAAIVSKSCVAAPLAALLLLTASSGAQAKGCIKGAAVGAVAGHFARHHAVLGAAAGCIVGHHLAKKKEREEKERREERRRQEKQPKQRRRSEAGGR